MSDPSLLYLQMLPVEQKGWLTLHLNEKEPLTAQAMIGHVGSDSTVLLVSKQTPGLPAQIARAEFRYITKSGIYTITSGNLDIHPKEEGKLLLTLYPPYEMTHKQQRDFIRAEPDNPIDMQFSPLFPDDYRPGNAVIKDMSGSGLRFVTDEFVHKDSILNFQFFLPERDKPVFGVGTVVRKEFMDGETITSIRFLDIKPEDQRAIIAYSVAQQLRLAETQVMQKRKFARVKLTSPLAVKVRGIDSESIYHAAAVNLGGGGMLIHAAADIGDYPLYHLSFTLPEQDGTLEAYAKIVERQERDGHTDYHFEFVEISETNRHMIVRYVLEQQFSLLDEPPHVVVVN
jgi:c-di-GMP-binding flagellar brake protein YcgR